MRISEFNSQTHAYSSFIEKAMANANTPAFWTEKMAILRACFQQQMGPLTERKNRDYLGSLIYEVQRIHKIFMAGLEQSPVVQTAWDQDRFRNGWDDAIDLPVASETQKLLSEKLFIVEDSDEDVSIMFSLGNDLREMSDDLIARCIASGHDFKLSFRDTDFNDFLLTQLTPEQAQEYGERSDPLSDDVTHRILADYNTIENKVISSVPAEINAGFSAGIRKGFSRLLAGEVKTVLTLLPSRFDAERDALSYDDYLTLFFEACDQPWDAITEAQDKLIEKFNAAAHVRFTNDDGTDLEMSLTDADGTPFTFCNSVIARNIPGSEIFSAPRRDSVNGTIVAKGKFTPRQNLQGTIENLTMEFKDGQLVNFSADDGADFFQEYLDIHENHSFIGELGIGTNPHIRKHLANILLAEKISGSFHVALGDAYTFKDYLGTPVHVDNGNKSTLHWDIPTMLYGKGGCIYLDGEPIMVNGEFVGREFDVLNRGWSAIPVEDRPDYWKDYKGPFTGTTLS